MNILVFGGTRFTGPHMVNELLAKGHSVTIATRGVIKDNFSDTVNRLIVERTSGKSIADAVQNQHFDAVIDTTAYCSNDIKCLFEAVECKRYIQISSMSVYEDLHMDIKEEEFDANRKTLVYCDRPDFTYDEIKRQAECAIVQAHKEISAVRIRFPYIIGQDDYTKRLYFYVEHILKQQPMCVDNIDAQMSFVRSDEAGKFAAFFVDNNFEGAINGASEQTIDLSKIFEYITLKTGKSPVLSAKGETAPYNETPDYTLNTSKAFGAGFAFTPLKSWIFDLLDCYITIIK